ncbi:hypothetical protein HDU84_001758 [Entophlyctis sp. JEL0112]|nr:hypothetical protein HDU84_001758 [Entophlyctis sp. JEL0112]
MDTTSTAQSWLILLTVLPEALTETMLLPLVPFLIRHLSRDVPKDQLEAVIGGRSGIAGHLCFWFLKVAKTGVFNGMFHFPLLIMNIVWGTLSDVLGRKPILLLGVAVSGITTFALGINASYGVALLCRFVAGVFGANSAVAKGGLGEINTNEQSRSWAYAMVGVLYGIGGFVGPTIGGLLVGSTADSDEEIYPFFAPFLFSASLAAVVIPIAAVYFVEPKLLKRLHQETEEGSTRAIEAVSFQSQLRSLISTQGVQKLYSDLREIFTVQSMFPMILYACICFCNMCWVTLFPLLFATSTDNGGLGYSPFGSSMAITILAVSKIIFLTFACQPIVLRIGLNKSFRLGMVVIVPACMLISLLGGGSPDFTWPLVVVCMTMIGFVEALAYTCANAMITESAAQSSLGAAHGLASTFAALVRTLAPAISGLAWQLTAVNARRPWAAFLVVEAAAVLSVIAAARGQALSSRGYLALDERSRA